jgi:signal transduction histidine kinase
MSSLRTKILTSFGLSKIALLFFAVIVIADLLYLKTRILEGEAVNDFYVASHELRRDEKNLFLYHKLDDFRQSLAQINAVENALINGRQIFIEIASKRELKFIDEVLPYYRQQLEDYLKLDPADRSSQQDTIRKSGQALLALANDFSRRERAKLAHTARVAAWTLLAALLTVLLLGLGSALFIVRQVVRPLGKLERELDAVAESSNKIMTLPSQDKEIQSVVHHFNDMLERLNVQQNQLRKHEKAAALGVLASGVAHELNNPISNISTSVQLLLESNESTDINLQRQWMTHIDEESERARRIVRRLLDSVRQPKRHVRRHNLSELIQTSVSLVARQLPNQAQVQVVNLPDCMISLDRERMLQVFINLIKNAADAGAKNIWIDAKEADWQEVQPSTMDHLVGDMSIVVQASGVIYIQITDDGPGIDPENLAKIFDPFFTTHSAGDGTGLGLYLVEEIISEHDGCIAVENNKQGGTRFMIWLPQTEELEVA